MGGRGLTVAFDGRVLVPQYAHDKERREMTRRKLLAGMGLCGLAVLPLSCSAKAKKTEETEEAPKLDEMSQAGGAGEKSKSEETK